MISIQIAQQLRMLIVNNQSIVPRNKVYLYNIPEDMQRLETMPIIRINHITSSATVHSSNELNMTRERFQVQYFFDDNDDRDIEGMISDIDEVLRDNGFYYSNGYDSYDPDLNGVLTVTRQYNYRNNFIQNK
ncbi:hypothetical protein [Staphylococcus phage PMBT8]|nr:hypothetical protein [Staphylococcus phage PMBT8]